MKRTVSLFALCCLVSLGFGCSNPDRTGATTGTQTSTATETCQPAIFYACGKCDDGSPAWKQCNDDGKTFAACACSAPAPKADAGSPAPTSTSTVTATSTSTATQTTTVTVIVVVTPDSGAPPPSGCRHKDGYVAEGSIRPCGYDSGECRPGTQTCVGHDWSECSGGTMPTAEVCDGKDNDCNGKLDDGLICACDPAKGPERPCGGHDNVGTCKAGRQQCLPVDNGFQWSTECKGEVLPKPETCNLQDDDCDGTVDNGFNLNAACQGVGECGTGKIECDFATGGAKCSTLPGGTNYHPVPELCDGKDNDCDGQIDEDFFVGVPCSGTGACNVPGIYECDGRYGYKCSTGPKGTNSKATAEICSDLVDNNCDGIVNEGCECKNGDKRPCGPVNADGSPNQTGECRNDWQVCAGGMWPTTCPKAVFPSPELCDGKDNDCDGSVDEGFGLGTACQGIGECGAGVIECNPQTNGTRCSTQIGGSQYHPMPELCDGKDNDCDGQIDEDYFVGAPCIGMGACAASPGVYECDGLQSFKCSTGSKGTNSKATAEICSDLVDNNCDGVVNENCKCNDGETRLCGPTKADGSLNQTGECRGITQTCANGAWPATCLGAIYPTAETCDGKDNDCDGVVDNGFNIGSVCQGTGECGVGKLECASATTTRCSTMPGASQDKSSPELCDGKDNDCDGAIDEDFFVGAPCTGLGACGKGKLECASTATTRCSTMPGASGDRSQPEICSDLVDNNCDGAVNENCKCNDGETRLCGPTNADGSPNQTGVCRNVVVTCKGGVWPDTCPAAVYPSPELCDGKDNDCDGVVDNGFNIGSVCQGTGECGAGKLECASVSATRCSTMPGASQDKSSPELCDGKDNDCDGQIDETFFVGAPCIGLGVCGAGKLECASVSATRCSVAPGGSADKSTPEVCDAAMRDENCDGSVNENCACKPGDPDIVCGVSNIGECHFGTQSCLPNGTRAACVGAINPSPELCDDKDNDCNGVTDNGFNKQTDAANCGSCGNACSFANATAACQAGTCTLVACDANYFNRNGSAADGCETGCMPTRGGTEYCDSIDNDCDGVIDNANATVQSDPFNCGACGKVCALPNVAVNGCSSGSCTIIHCLPDWADLTAEPGCETLVVPPSGTGGAPGTGGTIGTGGDTGTGGATGTGGNTGIDGGAGAGGGVVIPNSIGTIVCTLTGATMMVTVNGIVSLGLDSELPSGSISSLALGMDWGTCWPANGNPAGCFQLAVDPNTVDSTVHTWTNIPQTRFTPRVTSSAWFQLREWTILGDCIREGCSFCRPGEVCEPTLEPPNGCIAKAKPAP